MPDWADDQHTVRGRRLGRGLKFFRDESAKLYPAPAEPDPYEDEAYRLWALADRASRHEAGEQQIQNPLNRKPLADH